MRNKLLQLRRKQTANRPATRARRQSGIALLSAMISLMIISTTVMTGLAGVSTASRVTAGTANRTEAAVVTASQIDAIRDAEYVATGGQYGLVTAPAGMTISNETAAIAGGNGNIQAVTVRISKGSETVLETTIIKAAR